MTEKIKKIDIHVHSRERQVLARMQNNAPFATPAQIRVKYDEWGIEKGVLLPGVNNECEHQMQSNEDAYDLAQKYSDTFYWFCNIHPRMGLNSVDTDFSYFLNIYKKLGAKGVGEMTCNMHFDDPLVYNLLHHCELCDMPVTIHIAHQIGDCYGVVDQVGLPKLEKVLNDFPKLKILGHSTGFWSHIGTNVNNDNWQEYVKGSVKPGRLVELFKNYDNLLGDLSAGSGGNAIIRDEEFGLWFLNEFQDRLYFGTDICADYNQFELPGWLDKQYEQGKLSETVYKKVCRENALKLLGEI